MRRQRDPSPEPTCPSRRYQRDPSPKPTRPTRRHQRDPSCDPSPEPTRPTRHHQCDPSRDQHHQRDTSQDHHHRSESSRQRQHDHRQREPTVTTDTRVIVVSNTPVTLDSLTMVGMTSMTQVVHHLDHLRRHAGQKRYRSHGIAEQNHQAGHGARGTAATATVLINCSTSSSSSSSSSTDSSSYETSDSSSRSRCRRYHKRRHQHQTSQLGKQCTSALHILCSSHSEQVEKQDQGGYVNFDLLLLDMQKPPLLQSRSSAKKRDKLKQHVTDLPSWLEAWNRFACAKIADHPVMALELAKYQAIMGMFFAKHQPQLCCFDKLQHKTRRLGGTSSKMCMYGLSHSDKTFVAKTTYYITTWTRTTSNKAFLRQGNPHHNRQRNLQAVQPRQMY